MYKCSVKAQLVMDQVRARCQSDTQTNNKWTGRSGNYMYIMGRENADGKATGVVHKIAEDGSHKLCGSFKIMSDGIITRFTGLSKDYLKNDLIKYVILSYQLNSVMTVPPKSVKCPIVCFDAR